MAVVVSNEQGEVDRFRKAGLDIIPHRKLMKDGFTDEDGKRVDVETAFKREDHPFRVVIVCAMWLTGFDVPSLSTLYLDKPLQAHTRASFRQGIYDHLLGDETGLPAGKYSIEDVDSATDAIFGFFAARPSNFEFGPHASVT